MASLVLVVSDLGPHPARVVDLLDTLTALGGRYRAWELLDGDVYTDGATYYELTAHRLRNKIATREESMAELRRYAERCGDTD